MKVMLVRSLDNKEKIMVYYLDKNGELTQRIVRVLQVNDESILAYCYYRKQVRSLKLDNILSCGPINRSRKGA